MIADQKEQFEKLCQRKKVLDVEYADLVSKSEGIGRSSNTADMLSMARYFAAGELAELSDEQLKEVQEVALELDRMIKSECEKRHLK